LNFANRRFEGTSNKTYGTKKTSFSYVRWLLNGISSLEMAAYWDKVSIDVGTSENYSNWKLPSDNDVVVRALHAKRCFEPFNFGVADVRSV
jgi:hypothetical protein